MIQSNHVPLRHVGERVVQGMALLGHQYRSHSRLCTQHQSGTRSSPHGELIVMHMWRTPGCSQIPLCHLHRRSELELPQHVPLRRLPADIQTDQPVVSMYRLLVLHLEGCGGCVGHGPGPPQGGGEVEHGVELWPVAEGQWLVRVGQRAGAVGVALDQHDVLLRQHALMADIVRDDGRLQHRAARPPLGRCRDDGDLGCPPSSPAPGLTPPSTSQPWRVAELRCAAPTPRRPPVPA